MKKTARLLLLVTLGGVGLAALDHGASGDGDGDARRKDRSSHAQAAAPLAP
jgi:hypothetical protein